MAIKVGQVDWDERRIIVVEKGEKVNVVYFLNETKRALHAYLREREPEDDEPLFTSEWGRAGGTALTRSGVRQIVRRSARAAGMDGVRCYPHKLRHTFATMFASANGSEKVLQSLLGHSSRAMTHHYMNLGAGDNQSQYKRFSPIAQLNERN